MRPPIQTKALQQQHENTRHLPQQQTTQYQAINQFNPEEANVAYTANLNTATGAAPLLAATVETKAQQKHLHEAKVKSSKDLLVENKLLKHKQQFAFVLGQQDVIPANEALVTTTTTTTGDIVRPRALSTPIGIHTCQSKEQLQLQQQNQNQNQNQHYHQNQNQHQLPNHHHQQHQQHEDLNFLDEEDSDGIQLVDVKENLTTKRQQQTPTGNSPFVASTTTTTTSAIITTRPHSYNNSSNSSNSIQRNSLSSQYSRSSSSSDEPSSCSLSYSSRANTFDDAAEHFIINFPSDSATHAQPHPPYYLDENTCSNSLPLSETEPLLTNIEATVNDSKRSICLTKNSASLVFTRKDLLSKLPVTSANNNSKHLLAKQTPALQSKIKSSQSFRLANENPTNQRTKHLPPTFHRHLYQAHQQHRRSLQLNYNNNLVTTTTCCNSNNNYCCNHGIGSKTGKNNSSVPKRRLGVSGPVVGTLTYNKTAAITRKQHAYSWYAPVYSALEEELEHDSRDSSPIHNLANSKQKSSHNQHYQYKNNYNSGSGNVGTENESVALIESRNHHHHQAKIQTISSISNQGGSGSGNIGGGGNIGSVGSGIIGNIGSGKRDSINSQNQNQGGRRKSSNINAGGNQQIGGGSGGGGGGGSNSLIFPSKNHYNNINSNNNQRGNYNSEIQGLAVNIEEGSGLQASSLGLAGGPLPTRKRFGNFLKSLVGLRSASTSSSSSSNTSISNTNTNTNTNINSNTNISSNINGNGNGATNVNESTSTTTKYSTASRNNSSPDRSRIASSASASASPPPQPPKTLAIQRPLSPEITITRTPSEQNMVVLRDPRGYNDREKHYRQNKEGSTSSLNVVQQKIRNIIRREQSANSLLQEKSQSIVQYTASLRKCETSVSLTGQVTAASQLMFNNDFGSSKRSSNSNIYTGSGVFSPNGIEQIRPLNRLRPSVTSIQATCSRCSSLLSLAASGSRSSLSSSFHQGLANSTSYLQLQYIQPKVGGGKDKSSSSLFNGSYQKRLERLGKQNEKQEVGGEDNCSNNSLNTTTASVPLKTIQIQRNCNKSIGSLDSLNKSISPSKKQMQSDDQHQHQNQYPHHHQHQKPSFNSSHSMPATELNSPVSPTFEMAKSNTSMNLENSNRSSLNRKAGSRECDLDMSNSLFTFLTPSASQTNSTDSLDGGNNLKQNCQTMTDSNNSNVLQHQGEEKEPEEQQQEQEEQLPFESFTCKLCLADVEDGNEATKLQQCGCRFCTECMKAYVEYEISEAAYEISCPDAQCPTQGVMTLAEISDLTTTNLMNKHHRYRLNKEIELDKTRTWCPRAGCETVCNVGVGPHSNDATPSTSTFNKTQSGSSNGSSPTAVTTFTTGTNKEKTVTWAVQCPTCKDEFCSACKKSWHPNISCEEHSRRLVADGQDDIGIPFDNDLIKCCPMCAVPIEKDEGCAQMMCKRCKHVFCWYCLASLDDDFLLRHYDKGPCKNKLGHSRASVVWHRAQVIGIFAGFGILLLVASPLLLLAAPCIICCKCRSCSGSKIDDGEDELDEATALQSS